MKGWKIVSALMALVLCLGMVPQVVLASAEIAVEEPVLEELATTDASDRISLKNATVTLPQDSYKYTGNARKPKPTVTLNGVTLTKGTDYKVTYKNNTEVGTATVIIKGKGNYTGTVKITFKINPKGTTLSSVKSSAAGKIRVKWKKNAAVTGYQIQYSTKKSFSSAKKVTVKKNSTTSKTISDLKQGKKYYVRIRTYVKVDGETYFSAWSKSKAVKIKSAAAGDDADSYAKTMFGWSSCAFYMSDGTLMEEQQANYDENGRMAGFTAHIVRPQDDTVTTTISYDDESRVVSVGNSNPARYYFGADGKPVKLIGANGSENSFEQLSDSEFMLPTDYGVYSIVTLDGTGHMTAWTYYESDGSVLSYSLYNYD